MHSDISDYLLALVRDTPRQCIGHPRKRTARPLNGCDDDPRIDRVCDATGHSTWTTWHANKRNLGHRVSPSYLFPHGRRGRR
jgi:hypothetical protein